MSGPAAPNHGVYFNMLRITNPARRPSQRIAPAAAALCGVLLAGPAIAQDASALSPFDGVQAELSVTHDNNVSRGRSASDTLSDQFYSLQFNKDWVVPVTAQSRLTFTGTTGGEAFVRYSGLDRVFGEGRASIDYRRSGEFDAVTLGSFVRVGGDYYKSPLRSGYRYAVGATLQRALTDRIHVFGLIAYEDRHAESAVFTGRGSSVRLNFDYALSGRGTLYAVADYRRGDVVSSGRRSLENTDTAKVLVPDAAFPGRDFFTYRFDADTVVTTLGYNHGFGPKASIDVSWRRAVSKPRLLPSFATTVPGRYVADQFSLSGVLRF